MIQQHTLQVFADYHQFYVWDSGVQPDAPVDYTETDMRRRVKVAPSVLVVLPIRNMTVPVVLSIHESDPGHEPSTSDHIVECDLELPSGQLQVEECCGEVKLATNLAPGVYAVRVRFENLDSLSDDALDGGDRYLIDLWPGPPRELRVTKQHKDPG